MNPPFLSLSIGLAALSVGCTDYGVTSHNAPPSAQIVNPEDGAEISAATSLELLGHASDADGRGDGLDATWLVDGAVVCGPEPTDAFGASRCVVEPDEGPHDIELVVRDGKGGSGADSVSIVVVDEPMPNRPPSAPEVRILPDAPLTDDDLAAQIAEPSVDPDGDPIVYRYRWLRNGIATALLDPVVDRAETRAGEVWTVEVTPSDERDDGPIGSASASVGNSPPRIDAVALTPDPVRTDEALSCVVSALDPDGDLVSIAYVWQVDGVVAGGGGAVLDGSWFSRGDAVSCTVTPSDGVASGASVTASATVANSLPTAPVVSIAPEQPEPGDALRCEIEQPSSDPDADPIGYTFAWVLDGAPFGGPVAATVHPGDTIPGAETEDGQGWACVVTPSDGIGDGPPGVASAGVGCAVSTWFPDADADGYGETAGAIAACTAPGSGWVLVGGDCADGDPAVSPAATEWCDGIDNDCDTTVDEPQAADAPPWYRDADSDGHGDPDDSVPGCEAPLGYVARPTDCDDTDPSVFPQAGDAAFDGIDGDCDGMDCEAAHHGAAYFAVCFGPWGWHDARLQCLLAGYDDLASVRDASEQAAIEDLLDSAGAATSHSPWIGYADEVIEGLWGWSDLSPGGYTSWGPGEPNGGTAESCAELNWPLGGGLWNDADCYDTSARRAGACAWRP